MEKVFTGVIQDLLNNYTRAPAEGEQEVMAAFRLYMARTEDPAFIVISNSSINPNDKSISKFQLIVDHDVIVFTLFNQDLVTRITVVQRPRVKDDPETQSVCIPPTRFSKSKQALETMRSSLLKFQAQLHKRLDEHPSKKIALDVIEKAKNN